MKNIEITDFKSSSDDTVFEFLVFLKERGFSFEFVSDFFSVEATHDATGRKILVAELTKYVETRAANLIRGVSPHDKVIFVNYEDREDYWFSLWPALNGSMGAHVHDSELGWIYTPGPQDTEDLRRNLLQKSGRFTVVDGELHKICRVCGSILPLSEFYLKPKVTRKAMDPYRNTCKECF